uniref:rRNA biogenesis protein RRP36 n=1 Tax=Xiphophorus maculatus TaxID=8083 RepID=A0A3B5PNY2_XIPMA
MRRREKQRQEAERKKKKTVSCSEEEDSDVEKKVSLFTLRGGEAEELRLSGHDDEDQNQSGGGAEEDSGGSEEEEVSEGESNDEGDDDDDDEEEEELEEEEANAEEDDDDDEEEEVSEEESNNEGDDDEDEEEEANAEEDDDDDEEEDAEEEGGHTGDGTELQTEEGIRKELSNMPFEDVIKLQQQVGTKAFNEAAFNNKKCRAVSSKKRLNKNRPMEISSKIPPSFLRQVIPAKKSTRRDPRFDSLSGEYKPEIFEKTYKFINDIKHREKEVIKKQLKKTKTDRKKKEKLEFLLKRLNNQERARLIQEQQRERELQFKKQQRERASRGERPFFLKKCKSESNTGPAHPQSSVSCPSHILCFHIHIILKKYYRTQRIGVRQRS